MYLKGFGIVCAVMLLGYGVSKCDTNQCAETIYASDVPRWLTQFDGDISYDDGVWYSDDLAIGVSPIEDGDICRV